MKKERTGKKGNVSRYSAALSERICGHIRCGDSLRKAAEKEGIPHPTVMNWARENADFANQYARACEERLAALEDKLLDLVEKGHEVAPRAEIGGNHVAGGQVGNRHTQMDACQADAEEVRRPCGVGSGRWRKKRRGDP